MAAEYIRGAKEKGGKRGEPESPSATDGFVGNARLRDAPRGTDVGRARRRLGVPTSGARDIGGAWRAPPIRHPRRGIFILLFTPRTEKSGSPVR